MIYIETDVLLSMKIKVYEHQQILLAFAIGKGGQ